MTQPTTNHLRLQLLSYDLSPRVLELLRVGKYELSRRDSFRARLFATNKRTTIPQAAISDLEESLHDKNFNAITISSSDEKGKFRMRLEVSPNNLLWADTRKAGGASPKDELIRMGFESLQVRIARLGIKNYPTVLDCFVPLERPNNGDSYQRALDWTVASFERANLDVASVGGVDVLHGKTGETWSSFANSLDVAPGGSDQNQGKFDRLHDIMICPAPVGEQFAKLLKDAVHAVHLVGANPLVAIGVPPGSDWRQHATERAQDLLVPPIAAPLEGTFINGPLNYPIYSAREYKDLDSRGMVPRLGWDWVLHPVIKPEHRKILGIEAEEMVVLPMQRMTAAQIEQQAAETLKQEEATAENILECYEQIYNRHFNSDYMRRVFERLSRLQRQNAHNSPSPSSR